MDVAGGLSLVQTILQLLDSAVWKETQSVLSVKSQLQKLKKTISTIDAILRDAERQERLHHGCPSHCDRDRLERLKEALYQADDLFDEVTTLAHLKPLMPGNKFTNEVSLFFSRFNQLRCAFTWSREIESIREMLDDIVKDHQLIADGFRHPAVLENSRVRNNPRETHSYVSLEKDVIVGRDDDKKTLIGKLLVDTTVEEDVSVVSIVGIGGLGKTTLAQLVYNDGMIQNQFPLKMWVCVSDDFNVKALVGQILAAATNKTDKDDLNMDQLQKNLQQVLDRNKYLLVLDDVWNENYEEWRKLKTLLVGGGRGSRIIVTTRSKKVADVVGSYWKHELKGLSDDDSWNLFKRMTLEPWQHQIEANLVGIGKEIVRKCANVPLAIRVIGSLLRGQGESRWEMLKNTDLANIKQDEIHGVLPVLKISYYYLPFHLKCCFSYCAVFPKDYRIMKEGLIRLWMAQGFIMPSLDGESFEDLGEEYFKQLLQRCFFQDVEQAEGTSDEIISCKMHDLIHDLAEEVAGTEILSSNCDTRCFNEKNRHVFIDSVTPEYPFDELTKMKRMRTFLCICAELPFGSEGLVVEVSKMKYLRVLSLNRSNLETLPSVIGELVHLRYLDLSDCMYLSLLPKSITKLYNLQTLKLKFCLTLERLPRELRKLVNLRHLDLSGCYGLRHMPPRMNSMTSLQKLTGFVLSGTRSARNWMSRSSDALSEGQGRLRKVLISNMGYLNSLPIHSFHHLSHLEIIDDQQMERLTTGEAGEVFRSGRLHSLRSLVIYNCNNLQSISGRGVWEHFTALESLRLRCLDELEMEDKDDVTDAEMPWRYLAPTLRSLELRYLPKLVKLPKGIGCLSSLQSLGIDFCYNLETLPPSIGGLSSLQSLTIDNSSKLKSMPEEMRHLTSLRKLVLRACSPELKKRCKKPAGADWHNIQHVPNIYIHSD